ncbi:ArsC/Spx/MgsR family protein [uncultured Planktosalinus sp.]|uniref:arsenate reductase family protein n=1 Tax=uncultured Planktosalinus sp. TaxID=1810935 RepID=UPI0030DD3814
MKTFYYLSTCSTCKRIMEALPLDSKTDLRDIKKNTITEKELEVMKSLSGTYESLFSKRAQLYKQRDLKNKKLSENDYKNLILEHYTFLKRPVLVLENQIFIGNASKTIEAAKTALDEQS